MKKKQRKKLANMLFKVITITAVVCLISLGALIGCYNLFFHQEGGSTSREDRGKGQTKEEKENDVLNETLAVFGVDKDGYRTDVIFVVNFNSETNKVKVVSIPRDTKVVWSEEQKQKLRDNGHYAVSVSKINEMTAYGGIDNIKDYTIDEIENILGIKIDNYVLVTLDAFKEIVDAIGGVDMYVPQDMYRVDHAGGLYINLQEGQQHLDGEKAEQLVRFRGYPEGDVGRIEVQQAFLKAFAEKVMSPTVITKIPKMINILFNSVKTDVSLTEIPKYYSHVKDFDLNNLSFHTLPGEGRYENGVSYFFPETDEIEGFVQEVFFDQTVEGEEGEDEIIEDKSVSIEILNGSGVQGAAGRGKDTLEKSGYTVSRIDNYEHTDVEQTVIYAKNPKLAYQFRVFYPGAEIQENDSLEYDIQIVIGME